MNRRKAALTLHSRPRALPILIALCSLDACSATTPADPASAGASAGGRAGDAAGAVGAGLAGASGGADTGLGGNVSPPAGGSGGTVLPDGGSMGTPDPGAGGTLSGGGAGPHGGSSGAAGAGSGVYNHRVLLGSGTGLIVVVSDDGSKFEFQLDYKSLGRPGAETEGNDAVMLPNGDIAFTFSAGAEEVKPDKTVVWRFDNPAGTETQGITPIENGHFMVAETHSGGLAYLRELDAMGKVVNSITVNSGTGAGPHQQFREIRKTPQGTYLVTYLGARKARELDATGKMIREFPCGSFVAVRLPNLNTLIACGSDHRVIEVDPQDKIVWDANIKNVPIMNGFMAGVQRLPNGNTGMCSFAGELGHDPGTPRCFEVTPDFKVVWQLKTPKVSGLDYWTALEYLDPNAWVGGVPLR